MFLFFVWIFCRIACFNRQQSSLFEGFYFIFIFNTGTVEIVCASLLTDKIVGEIFLHWHCRYLFQCCLSHSCLMSMVLLGLFNARRSPKNRLRQTNILHCARMILLHVGQRCNPLSLFVLLLQHEKDPRPFCPKFRWQVTAKHTCTQRMWL